MSLTESLAHKPSLSTRIAIVRAFFASNHPALEIDRFKQYFHYYELELSILRSEIYKQPASSIEAASHGDLVKAFRVLKEYPGLTRVQLRTKLGQSLNGVRQQDLDRFAELAVRLGFMLNVRQLQQVLQTRGVSIVQWHEEVPLRDVIDSSFPRSRWKLEARESRIHPLFTAAFMVEICGLKIHWTDCLADHLSLGRDGKHPNRRVLHVYPYKCCLKMLLETSDWTCLQRNQEGRLLSAQIPKEVLTETIQSLNLLFPHWDSATNVLLRKLGQDFHMMAPFEGPKTLNLMEFDHWRERLLEVHDVTFASPPASWRQLMLDRRNPQQFWTFWIALLILALTLVQTGTGIKQAV